MKAIVEGIVCGKLKGKIILTWMYCGIIRLEEELCNYSAGNIKVTGHIENTS